MPSGLVGAGAQDALQELLQQRLLEQRIADQKQQQAFENRMREQERMDRIAREREDDERMARAERRMSNAAGVQEMLGQRKVMDEQESDQELARVIETMPQGPGRRVVELRRRGLTGLQPEDIETPEERTAREAGGLKKLEQEAEIRARAEAKYRRPEKPDKPQYVQVMGADNKLQMMTPEEIRASGGVPTAGRGAGGLGAASTELRRKRVEAAKRSVAKLNELSQQIHTVGGPGGRISGAIRGGKARLGLDPVVHQFQRLRQPAALQLAVAIQGAQNLSDTDREAMAKLIPDETVEMETAVPMMNMLVEMLEENETAAPQAPPPGAPEMMTSRSGAKPKSKFSILDVK